MPSAIGAWREAVAATGGVIVKSVIPLPRALLLTSAMLVGTAVGLVAGIASMLLVTATIRPDVVIALVVGVPSAIGLLRVRARSVTLTVFGNRG